MYHFTHTGFPVRFGRKELAFDSSAWLYRVDKFWSELWQAYTASGYEELPVLIEQVLVFLV